MSELDRATALAKRAATLLPDPPAMADLELYMAWEDLVVTTAARLGVNAGLPAVDDPGCLPGPLTSAPTWRELLGLATVGASALVAASA